MNRNTLSQALAAALIVTVVAARSQAGNGAVNHAAPPANTHSGWLKSDLGKIMQPPAKSNPLDAADLLDKMEELKQRFVEKRSQEYAKETMVETIVAQAKAGRTSLFRTHRWKKTFVTSSSDGTLWKVADHRYRELSKLGERRHRITAIPNGYTLELSAKEVFQSNLGRGHSWIKGELTVTYRRNPLWIRLQVERDWETLIGRISA